MTERLGDSMRTVPEYDESGLRNVMGVLPGTESRSRSDVLLPE